VGENKHYVLATKTENPFRYLCKVPNKPDAYYVSTCIGLAHKFHSKAEVVFFINEYELNENYNINEVTPDDW